MGSCTLIRHGQASFGAANYDQLSPLGYRQCEALGQHWAERVAQRSATVQPALRAEHPSTPAPVVIRGSLERHRQSLEAFAAGWGGPLEDAWITPALNEYDSEALIRALPKVDLPPPQTPEGYKAHFRRLRQALVAWMAAEIAPEGMPTFAAFQQGIADVLNHVRQVHAASDVLVFSSGGPISVALAQLLGASSTMAVELNLRLRNSCYSELVHSTTRMQVVGINGLAHLEREGRWDWITHA